MNGPLIFLLIGVAIVLGSAFLGTYFPNTEDENADGGSVSLDMDA